MTTCSTPSCARRYNLLYFGDQGSCPAHRTPGQRDLVAELAERGARIGIKDGDHWPYGPNIHVDSRITLVDWAEQTGYRLARRPRRDCFHWITGQIRRCSALQEYNHPGRIIDDNYRALDHLTYWTRDGKPALILGQPYHPPREEWIERTTTEWPVHIEVTHPSPWYGAGTYGVLVTPA